MCPFGDQPSFRELEQFLVRSVVEDEESNPRTLNVSASPLGGEPGVRKSGGRLEEESRVHVCVDTPTEGRVVFKQREVNHRTSARLGGEWDLRGAKRLRTPLVRGTGLGRGARLPHHPLRPLCGGGWTVGGGTTGVWCPEITRGVAGPESGFNSIRMLEQ